jgi:hypothetical protein
MNALAIPARQTVDHTAAIEFIRRVGDTEFYYNIAKERDRRDGLNKLHAMLLLDEKVGNGLTLMQAKAEVARYFRGERGMSVSRLQDYYQLWRRGGQKTDKKGRKSGIFYESRNWRMFLPNYNNGDTDAVLRNEAFKAYINRLFADTSRPDATGNAIYERLVKQWYDGEEIPGFGNIREWCARRGRAVPTGIFRRPQDMPDGWSPRNLLRLLPKSTAARKYTQLGEHAAHSHWGDQLLRDRSKLMPFQLITFDDVRFDIRVIMEIPGKPAQVVYPTALFALDVATGTILAKAVVGNYTRDEDSDGGKAGTKRGFQQADMRWLVTSLLERYGIPKDWQMTLLVENASASLAEIDKKMFEQFAGIRCLSTGLVHNKLVASGFVEQGGMPWQKGWIEAYFRLVHCRINHLPGTVGRRYDLTAGHRESEARYTLRTLKEAYEKGIPINELQLPLLTIDQFHGLLDEYVMDLNFRTKHSLQGFIKVHEFQLPDEQWLRHDDPRAAQLIPVNAQLNTRMEAPIERMVRLLKGHERVPVHPRQLIPLAMDKRPITVRNEKITLTVSSLSNDPLIFRDENTAEMLREWNGKDKALIGFVAADAACVHLFTNDEDMVYLGSPENVKRIDMTDETTILCRAGQVDRSRNRIRDDVATLLEDRNQELANMRFKNSEVLNGDRMSTVIADAEANNRVKRKKQSKLSEARFDPEELIGATSNSEGDEDSSWDANVFL